MRRVPVLPAVEDNFEQKEVLSESETPEVLDIDKSERGEFKLQMKKWIFTENFSLGYKKSIMYQRLILGQK